MSLQHIQKNSPRLLPKPAKFEKNPPNGYRVIRKTKCGAGGAAGAGGARSSPIHKQASLAGRLIIPIPHIKTPPHLSILYFFSQTNGFQTQSCGPSLQCQVAVRSATFLMSSKTPHRRYGFTYQFLVLPDKKVKFMEFHLPSYCHCVN